jgi:hypothetical protein
MSFLKKSWKVIVTILSAILGLILLRQYFTRGLLAKLGLVKTGQDSAVIDAKIGGLKDNEAGLQSEADKLREAGNKPAEDLSSKEVEDFWNKKK